MEGLGSSSQSHNTISRSNTSAVPRCRDGLLHLVAAVGCYRSRKQRRPTLPSWSRSTCRQIQPTWMTTTYEQQQQWMQAQWEESDPACSRSGGVRLGVLQVWRSQTRRAPGVEESDSVCSRSGRVRLGVLQVWRSQTRRAPGVEESDSNSNSACFHVSKHHKFRHILVLVNIIDHYVY